MKILKGTIFHSILFGSCPVCQRESMYKNPNPYGSLKVLSMYERCSHCGTKYSLEPSFFYGAMYVSYGVGIAFGVAAFVISYLVFKIDLLPTYFIIVATIVIGLPLILRLSRNIWINLFMHYDSNKVKNNV